MPRSQSRDPARAVVECEILGRPLGRNEQIFYRDGDCTNISPSNLVVIPRPQRKRLYVCVGCGATECLTDQRPGALCGPCYQRSRQWILGVLECPSCGKVREFAIRSNGAHTRLWGEPKLDRNGWSLNRTCEYNPLTPFCPTCRKPFLKECITFENWRETFRDIARQELQIKERERRYDERMAMRERMGKKEVALWAQEFLTAGDGNLIELAKIVLSVPSVMTWFTNDFLERCGYGNKEEMGGSDGQG